MLHVSFSKNFSFASWIPLFSVNFLVFKETYSFYGSTIPILNKSKLETPSMVLLLSGVNIIPIIMKVLLTLFISNLIFFSLYPLPHLPCFSGLLSNTFALSIPSLFHNRSPVTKPSSKADVLNQYFSSCFNNSTAPLSPLNYNPNISLFFVQCFYYWVMSSTKPHYWFIDVFFNGKYIQIYICCVNNGNMMDIYQHNNKTIGN